MTGDSMMIEYERGTLKSRSPSHGRMGRVSPLDHCENNCMFNSLKTFLNAQLQGFWGFYHPLEETRTNSEIIFNKLTTGML